MSGSDRKPTVQILVPSFPPALGGIERLSFRLATGFTRLAPRVIALDEPGSAEFDVTHGLPIKRIYNFPRAGRRSLARLNLAAADDELRHRPDVVLSMHIRASYSAALLARAWRVPLVQYVHAVELPRQPKLARFVLSRAAATIAVSAYSAELACKYGADPVRVHLIHNGVDLPSGPRGPRAEVPTAVTVARLDDRYKGHDTILDSIPKIRAAIPDFRWVIVGDGTLRDELTARVAALGVSDAVEMAGAVDDAERDRLLDSAQVFALPSRVPAGGDGGEGFGIAYLEASAHGLPVIGGREGGARDAIVDGETGVLIDANSPDELADAVIALLGDPARAQALGAAGVERARAFAWPGVVEKVEALIEEVLARRRA